MHDLLFRRHLNTNFEWNQFSNSGDIRKYNVKNIEIDKLKAFIFQLQKTMEQILTKMYEH